MPGEKLDPEQAMSGTGYIAMKTQCAVLPVRLVCKDNLPKIFRRTDVIIGKPQPYEEYMAIEGGDPTRKQVSEYIFSKTCELSVEGAKMPRKA